MFQQVAQNAKFTCKEGRPNPRKVFIYIYCCTQGVIALNAPYAKLNTTNVFLLCVFNVLSPSLNFPERKNPSFTTFAAIKHRVLQSFVTSQREAKPLPWLVTTPLARRWLRPLRPPCFSTPPQHVEGPTQDLF